MPYLNNPFASRQYHFGASARDILPVTPSDSVDLTEVAFGLRVTTGGTVSFVTERGTTRTITLGSDSDLLVGVRRVNATGTTATGIFAYVV